MMRNGYGGGYAGPTRNYGGGGSNRGDHGSFYGNSYSGAGRGGAYNARGANGGFSSGAGFGGNQRSDFGSGAANGYGGGYGGDSGTANLPILKNIYHEHAAVQRREQADINFWLTENECTLNGQDIPRPIVDFRESTYPEPIINKLCVDYAKPTAIQSISWPVAMSGRDMISIAKTGSGKTLGFILPGIVHAMKQPPRRPGEGPSVLVLLPTRELALQVEEVARDYCKLMNQNICCCYGGAAKGDQARALKNGIDICIATPGRLLDFLEASTTNMRRCTYLVLDEADRMLDMGFEPQIRRIVSQIRTDRQSLMFSATWPKEVRKLASEFLLQDAIYLNVGSVKLEMTANKNIHQNVEIIQEYEKPARLSNLLNDIGDQKTLVFVSTKRKADDLCREMRNSGWPALCIHGDKEQGERNWVLKEFKEGRTTILLGTDVVARGIDVSDIKFVINYDYPNDHREYIHRIGRTGRRDEKGISHTFMTPNELHKAKELIEVLKEAQQDVPPELIEAMSNPNRPLRFEYENFKVAINA